MNFQVYSTSPLKKFTCNLLLLILPFLALAVGDKPDPSIVEYASLKSDAIQYELADCDQEASYYNNYLKASQFTTSMAMMATTEECNFVTACDGDADQNNVILTTCSNPSLRLGATGSFNMEVGVITSGWMIPDNATITEAYIQFTAKSNSVSAASFTVYGDDSDNSPLISVANDIHSRARTASTISWTPGTWTAGDAGFAQRTPDLTEIIQAIIDRPGYVMGNNLGLIIGGSGRRDAVAFEDVAGMAPQLCITYDVPDPPAQYCTSCPQVQMASLDGVPNFPSVDLLNVCSVPDTVSLLIYNNGECAIQNVQVTLDFDEGLSYGGFVEGHYPGDIATEFDVTDATKPTFLISEIDSAGVFVINIGMVADCNVDVESEKELNFDAAIDYQYATSGAPVTCNMQITEVGEYNGGIRIPVLNNLEILNDPYEVIIEDSNTPMCQTLLISQDGLNAKLSDFVLNITGLDYTNYEVTGVSVNGIAVTAGITQDIPGGAMDVIIDGQYFAPNFGPGANGDDIFDVNEDLNIEICYGVDGCTDTPMVLDYNVYYGCNNDICFDISTMNGVVKFEPNFGANASVIVSNKSYGGICGADLSYDITVSSLQSDPIDGLWQDLILKYKACLGNGMSLVGLDINGIALDASLYEIDGSTIIVDFSTNTNPAYGLQDLDGGGTLNDLEGGTSITLSTTIDISCADSSTSCDGDLACNLTNIDINGKRNCGQDFQEIEALRNAAGALDPISFFYGELSSMDNTMTIGTYGIPITEVVNTVNGVWNASMNAYSYEYVFGSDNIDPCTMPGPNGARMEISIVAAGQRIDHIRYTAGSAMYNGVAVPSTTSTYEVDPISGETVALKITIPAGDVSLANHDYDFNLDFEGFCAPNDYMYVSYKVVEECLGCGGGAPDPCEIVRSCGSAATYVDWNGSMCPCAMDAFIDTLYRVNYGYSDAAMTMPITIDDAHEDDRQRFLPGDTMFVRTGFTVYDVTELKKATDLWYLRLLQNYPNANGSKLRMDVANTQFLGWYWEDVSAGTITEIGVPTCFDNYPDATRDNKDYPSIRLVNMGVEDGSSSDPTGAYNTCLSDPDINPLYPPESAINYQQVSLGSSSHFDEIRLAVRWQLPSHGSCNPSEDTENNPCFEEFFIQFPMEDGDRLFFDVQGVMYHSPFVELEALNSGTAAEANNVYPSFIGYTYPAPSCSASSVISACTQSYPYQAHIPGPVTIKNNVIVEDCDTEVEYTFTLQNRTPSLAMNETPWFDGEYRPYMATEYLEFQFPQNMVYLNDGEIIMPDGSIVTFPPNYIDINYGNLNCIPDGSGGTCCVATDNTQLAAMRLVDQQFWDGLAMSYGTGPNGPNETGNFCDSPHLIHKRNDPYPHLMVGGTVNPISGESTSDSTYGIRYSLESLCPEDIEVTDFKLLYQFAEPYIPTLTGINPPGPSGEGAYEQPYESSSGVVYTTSPTALYPINPYGENCGMAPEGCRSFFGQIVPDPLVSTEANNPMRQTGMLTTTPDNFIDNSLNFPPLTPSVSSILIADVENANEVNVYMVCSENNGVDMGIHTNVATSLVIPVAVDLIDIQDAMGNSYNPVLAETTTEYNAYAISTPDLAPGDCTEIYIITELLFCPVGLNVDTEICATTTSGCIDPAKAALFSAAGAACDQVSACYKYVAEEADIQAEWQPDFGGEYPLCTTIPAGTVVKNVKPATLTDIDTDWWFPSGLNFVADSWQVCYPSGPGDPTAMPPIPPYDGPCFDIPDPTADAAANNVYGTNFGYEGDDIWSAALPNDEINMNGLKGVGSMLDSNFVQFKFEVETVCDEFVSGTSIWFQSSGADPCESRVESMFVPSNPLIIQNANPANFPQFFVFADPIDANCGVESQMTLTYLNTSPLGETMNSGICMDLETSTFAYVPGSVSFISPAGHTPTFTETTNGSITHICFDIPDGIGPGGAFQTGFSFTMPTDVACGEQQLNVQVSSEVMSQTCVDLGIMCSVDVLNSVNPLIDIDFLPPVTVEDQTLTVGCGNGDGTVPMCYTADLLNNGPFYSNDIKVALIQDLDMNGRLDPYDIKLDSATHNLVMINGETQMISGCFNVLESIACPVFLMIMQETNCVCDAQDFYYDSIEPDVVDALGDEFALCPMTPFGLENCGDWTYTVIPSAGGSLTPNTAGDSLLLNLNEGYGVSSPVTLRVTSQTGGCQPFNFDIDLYSLADFSFGPFAQQTVCSNGSAQLDLQIPAGYENSVTVEWSPKLYLDDYYSLTPTITNPLMNINYTVDLTFMASGETCLFTANYPVIVELQPVTSLFSNGNICNASQATFTAPAGYSNYNWIKINADGTETPVQVGPSDTYTALEASEYYLEYYNVGEICTSLSTIFNVAACPIMDKSIASVVPTSNPNEYTVTYEITVENDGAFATAYDLYDRPDYDLDISPISGSYTSDAGPSGGLSFPAPAAPGWLLGDDIALPANTTHTYNLVTVVSIDLEDGGTVDTGDDLYSLCGQGSGPANAVPGEALYNNASLDLDDDTTTLEVEDDECAELPYLIMNKSIVSTTPTGNNCFDLVYRIEVENIGGAAGQYDLVDDPNYDDDVTINSSIFTTDALGNPGGSLPTTSSSWVLANDQTIAPSKLDSFELHVDVCFNLEDGATPGNDTYDASCGTANGPTDPTGGEGLYNEALLDVNNDNTFDQTDEVCEDVPYFVFDKTTTSLTRQADRSYIVVYNVLVNNLGGAAGEYNLTDTPGFDTDVIMMTASYTSDVHAMTALAIPVPGTGWLLGEDIAIAPMTAHNYVITIHVSVDPTNPPAGGDGMITQCGSTNPTDPQAGEALYNEATLDTNDDGNPDFVDEECPDFDYPCEDIAGQIFYDWNNNGCQETGENFVTDEVTVNLYQCVNGANTGGTLIASTTTIGGMYEFGLDSPNTNGDVCLDPEEEYYIEFDLPNATGEALDGFAFATNDDFCGVPGNADDVNPGTGTSSCYDPSGDDDDLHIDSGIFPCQDIAGVVFYDMNNNGCQDPGETAATEDVTVSLYACNAGSNTGGTLVTSTTTINGAYEFGVNSPNTNADVCLEVGTEYYVVFDIPNATGEALEDWNFSTNSDACASTSDADDIDPTTGGSSCYDPSGDDDDLDIDAGIYPCQELGGEVFVDLNNNGCQDAGEVNTTEAVTVTLFQCNAGSNTGGTQVATTTTIGGAYEFGPDSPNTNGDICLDPAETYYVVFDLPNGVGEALENYNFSSNADMCTTTDLADDVDPSNGTTSCYDPSGDDDDEDIDAGIVPCQEMGGEVFVDLNNNGCQDAGEVNTTEAVTVTLYQCVMGSNTNGTQVATTTTINGAYEFGPDSPNANADVCLDPAEQYYVVFDIPNGTGEALEDYFLSTNSDMCANTNDSDDVDPTTATSTCYDPSGDDDDADVDAGIWPCQEMGGDVFVDLNNNGCQDAGEVNTTEAVTVTLFQCVMGSNTNGTQIATTTTINGAYEFGVDSPNAGGEVCLDPAEQYYVVFDIPNATGEALEDYFLSTNSDLCTNTDDSDDVDPTNGTSTCYDPSGDDDDADVDAGIVPCQEMGGEVFVDLNNNGCQDTGEVNTTEAVTVTLFQCVMGSNTNGTQVATTTTINGAYEFGPDSPNAGADVCLDPAEQYYVVFDIPNGTGEALEDYFLSTNAEVCANTNQADDVDPTNGTSACYDPSGDDDDEDVDAGIVPCQEMGGEVFVDLNNNGCQDAGEVNTTEAVTVTLFQCVAGSNTNGTQVATTTTINGAYEFGPDSPNAGGVICLDPAEQYYVVFDIPNGAGQALEDYFLSTNSEVCAAADQSDDVDPTNGTSTCYDPSDDDDDDDVDVGIVPCQEMGGDVFVDLNNNGCQDAGEVNTTEAVTVTLFQCVMGSNTNGTQVATTTTINGAYEFGPDSPNAGADVCLDPAEQYYVVFDLPDGPGQALEDYFLSTNSDVCANTNDSDDVDPTTATSGCYDPSDDDDDDDVDVGIVPCQEMGGEVFVDLNNNGCQDAGEVNTTEAVTVTLFQCVMGSNTNGTQVATTTTINGAYEFGPDSPNAGAEVCLDPAEQYYVVFDIPNGTGEALEDYFLSTNSAACAAADQADDVDPTTATSTCYDPSDNDGSDDDDDVDAGIVPCQEMGGEVFVDLNNNGCQDAGEVNTTEVVTVTLFQCTAGSNTGGTQVATTTTINGSYEFGPESPNSGGVICLDPAETYYVVFDLPDGPGEALEDYFVSTNSEVCASADQSDDVDPTTATSTCYDPSDDDDDDDIDVGIVPCQEMGGDVFVDVNNNGCQDAGEVNTTEAVTVTLFQCNAGSNTGGTQVATTTTINGSYEFGPDSPNANADVCLDPAEQYYVVFDLPDGPGQALEDHFFSTNSDLCANTNDSDDVDPTNGTSSCYDPSGDDDDEDVDAGIVPCQEMGGDVFVDVNNNGCQDAGEVNTTEAVTVTLYQCVAGSNTGGTQVATTTTINGSYEFGPDSPNVGGDVCLDPAEQYYVVFDLPDGPGQALEDYFLSTNSEVCANTNDSDDVDPTNGTSSCYDPSDDDDDEDVDAGIVPCQTMGGDVFVDVNNNGCQDAGEVNTTEAVTVTLYQCVAGSNTGGTQVTTTTTINGSYEFGPDSPNAGGEVCLDPAEMYYVVFSLPNGPGQALEDHFFSTNSDMCASTNDSDDIDPTNGTSTCYDPSDDDDDEDVDAGIVPCQEMGGEVFVDANNNGCQDAGEVNTTEAVTVTLYQCVAGSNSGGTQIATTTTINGSYEFGPDSPNADAEVCLDPAETYYVVFDIPNGVGEVLEDYFLSTNSEVCAAADQSDNVDPTNGTSSCYDPSDNDGSDDDDVDAGIVPCQTMGGEVFNDSNGDGCQGPGETNVTEDVTVTLYECNAGSNTGGTQVATTTTIGGTYEFGTNSPNAGADVCLDPALMYYVVFTLPSAVGESLENHSLTAGETVCGASDQSDDVDPTTGASDCYDPSDDDDDDDVDAGVTFYDLALTKTTNETGPFDYGDIITFDINVYNQGSQPANLIEISDYIPCGYAYESSNDPLWSYDANTGIATRVITSGLAPMTNTSVSIDLRLVSCTNAPEDGWTNYAEISDDDGVDVDSEADTDVDNDAGGTPDVPGEDDEINGTGNCDDCIQTVRVPLTDPANAPVVSEVYVDGMLLALPNYPYDLTSPAQAAQFLADCIALGYNVTEQLAADNSYVDISVLYPGQTFDSFNFNGGATYYFDCHSCTMGSHDEDDHDPERIEIFDLALNKTIANRGPYAEGEIAEFVHTVFNQGNVPAHNVIVTDYLNEGFIFNGGGTNSGWNPAGAYVERLIPGPIAPGDSVKVSLFLEITVPAGATAASWVNEAEISSADNDTDPTNTGPVDVDSQANNDPTDDNDVLPGDDNDDEVEEHANGDDEDDNDIADVIVVGGLGDTVWKDLDGDGLQDPNEPGVSGVVVRLYDCMGTLLSMDVTDVNGFYFFDNLIPGDYNVTFDISSQPDGCAFTLPNEGGDDALDSDVNLMGVAPCTTISGGEYDSTHDAGLLLLASLGDRVWHDLDADGTQDGGEPGIPGVEVTLYDGDGNIVETTTTDGNGNYLFDELYPGDYYVGFYNPDGLFMLTPSNQGGNDITDSDVDGSNGAGTTAITILSSGEHDPDWDAGYYKCVPIGETVWYDVNPNSILDSYENGINGMVVELWKLDNGVWTKYDEMTTGHKPGTPSDDGYYKFCAPPGTYQIRGTLPPYGLVPVIKDVNGYQSLTDANESVVDSDLSYNQQSDVFTVISGQTVCNIGAGYFAQAQVGNLVWNDLNADGMQSAGEPPVGGVQVRAFNITGDLVSTAVTDNTGKYNVGHLGQDDYYLKFTPPAGYAVTSAHMGDDNMDSDVDGTNGNNTTSFYSLVSGDEVMNVDAGMVIGVVPVTWLGFRASHERTHNALEWKTGTELNTSHFEIQRRLANETTFSTIAEMKAAGTSNEVITYTMDDEDIRYQGVYYYRIKQLDVNGSFDYSTVATVYVEGMDQADLSLYPNPASTEVTINFNTGRDAMVKMTLWNADGKLVKDNMINQDYESGVHAEKINIEDYAAGIYTVRINIGGTIINKKLVVIKN